MKKKHFDELLKIRKEFSSDSVAPLVPFVGPKFGKDGSPRLMYVGKATNGWGEELSIRDPMARHVKLTKDFLLDVVAPRKYKSQFWYHAVDLMHLLSKGSFPDDRDEATAWAIPKIYWSNLAKVGGNEGNAEGALKKAQISISVEILKEEIKAVKPDLVVLVSGGYLWKEVVCEVFPGGWDAIENVSRSVFEYQLDNPEIKGGVFASRHPQGWERTQRDFVSEEIRRLYLTKLSN